MDAIPIPWSVAFGLNAAAVATLGAMAGAWWERRRSRRMTLPTRRRNSNSPAASTTAAGRGLRLRNENTQGGTYQHDDDD